jgi:hypothetical protein
MTTQHRLHVVAPAAHNRLNLSNRPTSPDDGNSLAAVFHCVKKICEITSSVCGTHFGHFIRLSDLGRYPTLLTFSRQPQLARTMTMTLPGGPLRRAGVALTAVVLAPVAYCLAGPSWLAPCLAFEAPEGFFEKTA